MSLTSPMMFIKPPIFEPSSLICTIELWRSREEVLEWKLEWFCEKCEDCNWIQGFFFPTKILISKKFVKLSKTCKNLLKWLFDKLFCVKPILTNFSQFIELHETNFSSWLWRTHFRFEYQEILIQIEWDLFHYDLEAKIFHMNSS